jgi:nicotinamidase-related amidase
MSKSAFLVIDMLNDFFLEEPLSGRRSGLVSAINEVVRMFRENGQPIIWVRQEFKPDLSDAFLAMRKEDTRITIAGTEGAQILPEMDVQPVDHVIVKRRYSAFFRTTLDDLLSTLQPDLLVVGGVNTHACVRTTVIDAYQRDYHIAVASECTASYDDEHHEITRRYLDKKIARFLSNAEIHEMVGADTPGQDAIRRGRAATGRSTPDR